MSDCTWVNFLARIAVLDRKRSVWDLRFICVWSVFDLWLRRNHCWGCGCAANARV